MARRAEDLSADSVLAVINGDEEVGTLGDWLALLGGDERPGEDAGAADILREIRSTMGSPT